MALHPSNQRMGMKRSSATHAPVVRRDTGAQRRMMPVVIAWTRARCSDSRSSTAVGRHPAQAFLASILTLFASAQRRLTQCLRWLSVLGRRWESRVDNPCEWTPPLERPLVPGGLATNRVAPWLDDEPLPGLGRRALLWAADGGARPRGSASISSDDDQIASGHLGRGVSRARSYCSRTVR